MYISSNYSAESAQLMKDAQNSSKKSLIDFMDHDKKSSNGGDYFSDTVSLSAEAYGAIRNYDPEMLKSLGYEEEEKDLYKSSGSSLDKVELSEEAIAALRKSNPEVLESLGYNVDDE